MAFRVGMKVVCVKETPWLDALAGEIAPQFKQVLTIRAIYPGEPHEPSPYYFTFREIRNPQIYPDRGREAIFSSRHFRPVVDRKKQTDISCFLKLLNPQKEFETTTSHRTERAISTQAVEQGA